MYTKTSDAYPSYPRQVAQAVMDVLGGIPFTKEEQLEKKRLETGGLGVEGELDAINIISP